MPWLWIALSGCTWISPTHLDERADVDQDGYAWTRDCDDRDPSVHERTPWFPDEDGDGYGSSVEGTLSCGPPGPAWSPLTGDCADDDPLRNPQATEVCGGVDEDCDGRIDDDDPSLDLATARSWYPDEDGDGYGPDEAEVLACLPPADGWTAQGGDCDDRDPRLDPDTVWYLDEDGDGHGRADETRVQCAQPPGWVLSGTDCDDADPHVNPDAPEVCDNGVDDDCSGDAPECGLGRGAQGLSLATWHMTGQYAADALAYHALVDLNGDGALDLLAGAYYSSLGPTSGGAVYWVPGPIDDSEVAPSGVWTGSSAYAYLGTELTAAGDLDGDGIEDAAVGSLWADDNHGRVWILYGRETWPSTGDIADVAQGSVLGENWNDGLGWGAKGVGDVNGDGLDDLTVGAFGNDTGGSQGGALYLFLGDPERLAHATSAQDAHTTWVGSADHYVGYGQCTAGPTDLDGDGLTEISMGVWAEQAEDHRGALYLVYGDPDPVEGVLTLADTDAWLYSSDPERSIAGAVLQLGDLDGDGLDELGVQQYDDVSSGLCVLGGDTDRWSEEEELESKAWLVLTGERVGVGYAATSGDFNDDGYPDLAVGAPGDSTLAPSGGAVHVRYGPLTGGHVDTLDDDATLYGEIPLQKLSSYVISAGDLSGDGRDDLVVNSSDEGEGAGAIYLFPGRGL